MLGPFPLVKQTSESSTRGFVQRLSDIDLEFCLNILNPFFRRATIWSSLCGSPKSNGPCSGFQGWTLTDIHFIHIPFWIFWCTVELPCFHCFSFNFGIWVCLEGHMIAGEWWASIQGLWLSSGSGHWEAFGGTSSWFQAGYIHKNGNQWVKYEVFKHIF